MTEKNNQHKLVRAKNNMRPANIKDRSRYVMPIEWVAYGMVAILLIFFIIRLIT